MNTFRLLTVVICQCALLCTSPVMADHASPGFETGAAGAIMTVPGATMPEGDFVFGLGVQFIKFNALPDAELEALGAADENVHSTDSLLHPEINFAYGVTADLTIGVSLPYVQRNNIRAAHNDAGVGEVEFAGNSAGPGDMKLFGQYRFFKNSQGHVAVILGLKVPTGNSNQRENGGELFEAEHQPGSGSWDLLAGLALDRKFGRAGLSANILYTYSREGLQQTNLGEVFNYNLALSYRAWSSEGDHGQHHHQHAPGFVDYVDLALELNGDLRGRTEIGGVEEEHTGGHTLYISPGVRVGIGHHWSVYTSFGYPVMNDYNGRQSEPDYRVISGLSFIY